MVIEKNKTPTRDEIDWRFFNFGAVERAAEKDAKYIGDKTFGQFIREFRKTLGVNQLALARLLGRRSKGTFSDLENNKTQPTLGILRSLSDLVEKRLKEWDSNNFNLAAIKSSYIDYITERMRTVDNEGLRIAYDAKHAPERVSGFQLRRYYKMKIQTLTMLYKYKVDYLKRGKPPTGEDAA